jgi:hypothetical protein
MDKELTLSAYHVANANIAIATPTHNCTVDTEYLVSIWKSMQYFNQIGLRSNLLLSDGASVEKARNFLVARFLENPDFTHILFVDADQGWEPTDVLRLLAHDKLFVGAAVRKKTLDLRWNANFSNDAQVSEEGLLPANELGTGFLLLKREVLERMIDAHPDLKIRVDDTRLASDFLYMLFHFDLEEDGTYWSEDLAFSRRWRRMGGEIWIDPAAELTHMGRYNFRGCFGEQLTPEA